MSAAGKLDPSRLSASSLDAVRGSMAPLVYERLSKALGPRRAAEVMRDCLNQLGGSPMETAQDLLVFAGQLIKMPGLVQAVGRSLKVQALLLGATE